MKNRTVLGIICMVLAIITVFAVSPIVNRLTNGETTVLRISEDIKRGAKITQKDIEAVKVKASTVPKTAQTELVINTRKLSNAVDRMSLLTSEKIQSPQHNNSRRRHRKLR